MVLRVKVKAQFQGLYLTMRFFFFLLYLPRSLPSSLTDIMSVDLCLIYAFADPTRTTVPALWSSFYIYIST